MSIWQSLLCEPSKERRLCSNLIHPIVRYRSLTGKGRNSLLEFRILKSPLRHSLSILKSLLTAIFIELASFISFHSLHSFHYIHFAQTLTPVAFKMLYSFHTIAFSPAISWVHYVPPVLLIYVLRENIDLKINLYLKKSKALTYSQYLTYLTLFNLSYYFFSLFYSYLSLYIHNIINTCIIYNHINVLYNIFQYLNYLLQ